MPLKTVDHHLSLLRHVLLVSRRAVDAVDLRRCRARQFFTFSGSGSVGSKRVGRNAQGGIPRLCRTRWLPVSKPSSSVDTGRLLRPQDDISSELHGKCRLMTARLRYFSFSFAFLFNKIYGKSNQRFSASFFGKRLLSNLHLYHSSSRLPV